MRYIRTKDKIIDTDKDSGLIFTAPNGKQMIDFNMYGCFEIIKSANSINKLCDLYVDEETKTIFHKHNGYVINWKTNLVYSLEAVAKTFHSVKGAIFTEKGIIYVAKINDKGELELI